MMQTIRVERTLHAPAEQVFDLATDHAGYTALSGVTSARLVRAGTQERNGVGAIREIKAGPIRIHEEVTAFERPGLMDYRVVHSTVPLRHDLGRMVFSETEEGTHVIWTTVIGVDIPLLGRLLTPLAAKQLQQALSDALELWNTKLTAR